MPDDGERALLLEVGRVEKAHGLRGEVVVRLVTNVAERLAAGARLTGPDGELVVVASRPHGQRFLVTLEGVTTREAADALRGAVLRAEAVPADVDPEALWVHDLVGRSVVDQTGEERGRVTAVQDNPASDLLVLDTGHLVPLRFVTALDDDAGRVLVDVPDGLFEL